MDSAPDKVAAIVVADGGQPHCSRSRDRRLSPYRSARRPAADANTGRRALRMLGVERDTTINALAIEALNDLLKKYGKRQSVENPLLN